ncbi:MAG: NUDIX hydrolase [Thermus sp.]|uniref:NUDIX domain-containing protein n=1 Tax=unclassified Thermus TaxID=2619321 RepID=UPI000238A3F1|nr:MULTISPECIES: NUDIX hydrolase [unclassified Thermus]AEV16305.1 Phosphohydrolase (MutT/nudix family protein) [Thermus sp. CCB_US3_UF1]MCS7219000.1 NUDIX hydrolase [Thermus sp.]MCX7850386.1 NUDIX hydrolase [Thermus sp.]MDW8018130.1 NUDIX hydrolase [Thermus sp.]MDW8358409.1 NUDIX hydrolase [Thermus sp.]
MSPWERLFIEEVLSEPVRVVRERVRTHTGKEITYIYRPGPVAASFVLPITPRATALLVRQYRHPTGKFLLEIPAGKVDPGETPEEAARRELLEEVGARAAEVLPLPPFHPQPSFTAVVFHPFLALGAEVVAKPALEDGELLETLELPLVELYALLERGQVEDASTALTLFYARPHLRERGLL